MTFDFSTLDEYEKTHPPFKRKELEPDRHWPERIKKLRKTLGYTQEDFALFMGCTTSSIHKWESGRRNPVRFYQQRLAMAEEKFVLPIILKEQKEKIEQEDKERIDGKRIIEAGS